MKVRISSINIHINFSTVQVTKVNNSLFYTLLPSHTSFDFLHVLVSPYKILCAELFQDFLNLKKNVKLGLIQDDLCHALHCIANDFSDVITQRNARELYGWLRQRITPKLFITKLLETRRRLDAGEQNPQRGDACWVLLVFSFCIVGVTLYFCCNEWKYW